MITTRAVNRMIGVAWVLLAACLISAVAVWAVDLARTFDRPAPRAAATQSLPVAPIATFVTQYPQEPQLTPKQLCAQYEPKYNAIVVDAVNGSVIANIRC